MRIALVGPFSGESLRSRFTFPVGETLPVGYRGAPLMAILARKLIDKGCTLAAITTDQATVPGPDGPFRVVEGDGIRVYFCPERAHGFRWSQGRVGRAVDLFLHERRALVQALAHFQPDVVHAHWTYEFAWGAVESGFPVLATAHDSPMRVFRFKPDLYRGVRMLMARHVIRKCLNLSAVSPDLAADIGHLAGRSVHVVANMLDDPLLASEPCSAGNFHSAKLIMVLNGWQGWKNGDQALRAFCIARKRDTRLKLCCYGDEWEPNGPAHLWAVRHGMDVGVDFLGPAPHDQILSEMRRSSVLLHPSRLEACSMVIAEAMGLGLPVIAGRRTGGVAWQLDEGRAGMLFDVEDCDEMVSAITALTSSREQWMQIARASRARAAEMFSSDAIADRYLDLYTHVIRSAGASSATSSPPSAAKGEIDTVTRGNAV